MPVKESQISIRYHIVCSECFVSLKICAKCTKEKSMAEKQRGKSRLREELKFMIFCEKHTFFKTTGESWQRENEQWRVGGGGRRWKWG